MRNIIFGPPGTGKTTHLLRIVEKELKENNVPPQKIAYLAFTNQAADEALSRAISQMNYSKKEFTNFRTLHSLAYRQLHLKEENIMNDEDYNYVSNKIQIKLSNPNNKVKQYGVGHPSDVFIQVIDGAKIRGLTTESYFGYPDIGHLDGGLTKLKYIDEALIKYKNSRNKYDMTDMIVDFNRMHYDRMPNFDVVIVDEAQDLSWLQWKMVERITATAKRVYVAGDDDQAIFLWAGARPEFLMNMEGNRTILNKSYRLSKLIHAKADKLIRRVKGRVEKEWTSRDDLGEVKIFPNEQLDNLREGKWLVLARHGHRLTKIEDDMKKKGLYYLKTNRDGKKEPSISERVRRAILGWLALCQGRSIDYTTVKSCYTYIQTGAGVDKEHKAMKGANKDAMYSHEKLCEDHGLKIGKDQPWFKSLVNLSSTNVEIIRELLRRGENIRLEPRIELSTIHGSKGGEADNVMLFTDLPRKADMKYWNDKDEERRVFYVGMTRARNKLHLVRAQTSKEFSEIF